MITLGTRTFYRHYTQSQFETNVDYGYGTDYTLSHQRQVTITSGDAIYYLGFILQHRTNPSIFSSAFWKIERVSGVNTVSVRDRETDPWVLHPNQSNYQALNITLLNIFGLGFVNNFFTEEAGSGTYDVLEKIYQDGDPIPTPASVWAFDLRYLVLRGLAPLKDKVDPVSKNNKCQLRGEWRTLPVSTTLYAGGWTPTSALSWTLELKDTALNNIAVVTGSTAVTAPAPVTGKIADFSYDWDCKSTAGKTKYGVTFPVAFASASVPNAGQTTSRKLNTRVLCTRCACVDGILRMLLSLDSVGSDAGNPLTATMAFSGMFASDAPASMGYGWKSNTGIRVYEDPVNLDLIYENEAGSSMRWTNQAGTYVPYTEDNYSKIVKVTGNPNYTYAITFEDQTRREFDAAGLLLKDIDRNGNVNTYDRSSGNLVISDGKGRALYYDYGLTPRADGQTQTLRVNDPVAGRLTTFSYYSNSDPVSPDRLQTITDPAGETTTFIYLSTGQISQILDARGNVMSQFAYDSLGRKVIEQTYDQSQTQWAYGDQSILFPAPLDFFIDAVQVRQFDLTTTSADPAWYRESHSFYDSFYNVLESWQLVDRTGPSNVINVSDFEFNDPLNPFLMTRQISPNGAITAMTYNAQGSLRTVTDDHLNVTTYDYVEDIDPTPINPKHQKLLRKIHRPQVTVNGVPTIYPATEMQYDANGNLIKIIDAQSQAINITRRPSDGLVTAVQDRRGFSTTFAYHATTANLISVTSPAGPGAAPARTTTMGYDLYDNVNQVQDPLLNTVSQLFDGKNRPTQMTDALGRQVFMNYFQGLMEWIEAPANQGTGSNRRRTKFSHDYSGRVDEVDAQIGPNNVTDYQPRVGYGYTGFSQLKSLSRLMNAATKSTAYEYDPLGRLVTSADFLNRPTQIFHEPFCVGNTAITPRGVEMASSFDTLCRLVQMETQEERHLYAYDELDRPTVVRVGERYAHEPNPNRVGSRYRDAIFKHDTAYEYDSLDRITKVTYPTGETVSYLYNAEGAVTQMTDVHGKITQYSYFNDGRLNTVTYQGQVFTYAYDLAGRLETITYPAGSNLVASFTTTSGATGWNPNGQLLCLRYLKNGAHFHRFEYTYDDSGNRISLIDTPENIAQQVTWDYGYDWLNRLSSVSRNGVQTAAYAYDESDNRTSLSLPLANEVWTYGYDLADQILSRSKSIGGGPVTLVESYGHDADGNMTARTNAGITTNYDWNTLNKLRQVKVGGVVVESTSYDHGGIRRLKKDSSGPSKSYSSGAMSLCDTRPTRPVSFIQGHQLLGLEESGNRYFFITDGLSSVRVVVNSSCVSQGEFRYDEFGNAEASSTPPAALSGHSYVGGLGQRNEGASLGIYYARQRFYDPQLGRFLNQDPIGFAGGLNLFTYVGQKPTNLVDPSGLDAYLWIREQRDQLPTDLTPDWGHAWLEVDTSPGNPRYSAGLWPGGPMCPDLYGNISKKRGYQLKQGDSVTGIMDGKQTTWRLAKIFRQSSTRDKEVIQHIQNDIKVNTGKPLLSFSIVPPLTKNRKGETTVNPTKFRACTTTSERWIRDSGLDPSIPIILQPNDLYNHYNPENRIRKGPIQYPPYPG